MSIQDVLAELQKTYIASIPEKVARIEALWASRTLRELETEFHKLKGTGRTYGLPEITSIGALMEGLCKDAQHIEHLTIAVPIVCRLLLSCRDQRLQKQIPQLDTDADFKTISLINPTKSTHAA